MNFFAEQKKFNVYITGSNSKLLSSELATRLTGRHRSIELYPLSFKEVALHQLPDLVEQAASYDAVLSMEERAALRKLFDIYYSVGGFPKTKN